MERDLVVLSFSTPNLSCESRYALLATDEVLRRKLDLQVEAVLGSVL